MIETNKIYCGDNLELLRNKTLFPDNSIDLIYLDPPFFSQKNYEQIWGDADEVRSFQDRWSGGITHYIGWMSERLKEMYRILKPTGSIYLHCDWHASHYLKVEMDKIFGDKNFINEIIWIRTTGAKPATRNLPTNTDSIFLYSKNDKYLFNPPYSPLTDKDITFFNKDDNDGLGKYKIDHLRNPGDRPNLKYTYIDKYGKSWKAPDRGWKVSLEVMKKLEEENRLHFGNTISRKYFLNERIKIGKQVNNVWDDIGNMYKKKSESLGYPTQKPEALIERITKASSNENDIILDPFCGCGTTVAVAKKLNRKFIGIDISPIACKLIASRINYPEFDIIGLPLNTTDLAKMKPHEFQQWVCDKMIAKNTSPDPKKHSGSDKGIDGIVNYSIEYPHIHGSPIQVKQSEGVGINVVKNLYATMLGMKARTGFIVALSFGSGAVEQVAKYKMEENEALRVDIKLIKAEDLCKIKYYDYGSILA